MGHHTRVNYSSSLVKVDIYYRITYFPRYILNENFKIKYLGIRNVHHNQQLRLDSGSRNLRRPGGILVRLVPRDLKIISQRLSALGYNW